MDLPIQEELFVRQSLAAQVIPSTKLLIKYHKTINDKGEYTTRLVIPATHVTATFSKLGYLGIKNIMDKAKVDYSSFTIIQAFNLKEKL